MLMLPKFTSAQSVEVFIEMAINNNFELEALRLEYEAAKKSAEYVSYFPDPTISLGVGVLPIETRLGAQRLKAGVFQSVPWRGQIKAQRETALAMAEVKSSFDDTKEINIEYAVRTLYSSMVMLVKKQNILEEKLKVLQRLKEYTELSVKSRKGNLSNILIIDRNFINRKSDCICRYFR